MEKSIAYPQKKRPKNNDKLSSNKPFRNHYFQVWSRHCTGKVGSNFSYSVLSVLRHLLAYPSFLSWGQLGWACENSKRNTTILRVLLHVMHSTALYMLDAGSGWSISTGQPTWACCKITSRAPQIIYWISSNNKIKLKVGHTVKHENNEV